MSCITMITLSGLSTFARVAANGQRSPGPCDLSLEGDPDTNGHKTWPFLNFGCADFSAVRMKRKPRERRAGGWRCNG